MKKLAKKATAKKAAPKKPKTNEVATVRKQAPAKVDIKKLLAETVGLGVSNAADDNVVQLVYVLQSLSPQVLKQKQEYIKGAEAGNIWFRGTKTVIDGEEIGIRAICVRKDTWWLEWGPERGQGLKGRYPCVPKSVDENEGRPETAEWIVDPKNPKKGKWTMPDGNLLNQSREHVVIVLPEEGESGEPGAYVIPMSGSQHSTARMWNTNMRSLRMPDEYGGKKAPAFGYVWRMKTIPLSNDAGDWFGWEIDHAGENDEPLCVLDLENGEEIFAMAAQLYQDFETGVKRADTADDVVDDSTADLADEADDAGI